MKKNYTPEDITFIKKWYGRKTLEQIAKHCHHSVTSIRWKIRDIDIQEPAERWNDDELARLKVFYGTMTIQELADRLGRTFSSVNNKIHRLHLDSSRKVGYNERGQKVNRSKYVSIYWSRQMTEDLARLFPTTRNTDLAELFGMSSRSISRKAAELHLSKDRGFIRNINASALKQMHFINKVHGNSGMIKPGEHKSPATEFKRKVV